MHKPVKNGICSRGIAVHHVIPVGHGQLGDDDGCLPPMAVQKCAIPGILSFLRLFVISSMMFFLWIDKIVICGLLQKLFFAADVSVLGRRERGGLRLTGTGALTVGLIIWILFYQEKSIGKKFMR